MSDLVFTLSKFAFLAALWLLILIVARVVKTDMFGKRVAAASLSAVPAHRGRRAPHQFQQAPTRFAITNGTQQGLSVPVQRTINLGRSPDSTIILEDEFCSARHAQLVQQNATTWLLSDLRSTNGTFLNGQAVGDEPVSVTVGDVIRIGRTLMRLEV